MKGLTHDMAKQQKTDQTTPTVPTYEISELDAVLEQMDDLVPFVRATELADNEVIFCISKIEDVDSSIAKSGKQWKLTISYFTEDEDGEGIELTRALSLGHNKQRDNDIQAYQQQLDASQDKTVHSCRLLVKRAPMSSIRQFKLISVSDNGQRACEH